MELTSRLMAIRAVEDSIRRTVSLAFDSHLVADVFMSSAFDALVKQSIDEFPPHVRESILSLETELGELEAVKALLPTDVARRRLFLAQESADQRAHARQVASYLIGVELGRRLGHIAGGGR